MSAMSGERREERGERREERGPHVISILKSSVLDLQDAHLCNTGMRCVKLFLVMRSKFSEFSFSGELADFSTGWFGRCLEHLG